MVEEQRLTAKQALLRALYENNRMRRGPLFKAAWEYAPHLSIYNLQSELYRLHTLRNKGYGRTKVIYFQWKGKGYFQLDKRYVYDGSTSEE